MINFSRKYRKYLEKFVLYLQFYGFKLRNLNPVEQVSNSVLRLSTNLLKTARYLDLNEALKLG
jgi:hypothetical protein